MGNRVSIFNSEVLCYTYISEGTLIRNTKIGKFCAIGPYTQIGLGKHPTGEFISSHPLFYSSRPQIGFSLLKESKFSEFEEINIGNDVWIGAGAIVLDGVTIGDGAVIAAGAVVINDVEPYSIVAGVPAKHKKYKFEESKIKEILNDPWWNKDLDWIKANLIQ
ncbi:CatB-related O-acetyltransferase [Paracrocinitomix mangrovi]|uniref:CatB-related O-acetyltransferase n=1 Tax=Paracrocinitomix mangrovi TaxID=2862509 RepID=UPI002342F318|nr:CatB-related O-acetyltransferase [Paracrocinitomix mangrovi]